MPTSDSPTGSSLTPATPVTTTGRGRTVHDAGSQAAFAEGFLDGRPSGAGPLGRSTAPKPPPEVPPNPPLALGAPLVSPDMDDEVVDAELL